VTGDTNSRLDVFVHDRQTGTTARVNLGPQGQQANGNTTQSSISGDGRYVAFDSTASNLVPGDTNRASDVFVRDRETGTTTRVSVRSNGNQANRRSDVPWISANGRYVVFDSNASNLVRGDTNGVTDVFVHDRRTGTTTRVSLRSDGIQANLAGEGPSISGDGRYVAFYSKASNLVRGDTNDKFDAFVHDRQTGKTRRVSVRSNGKQANGQTWSAEISENGRYVAFYSNASNLVRGDTNDKFDAFVHDRQTGKTRRVSVSTQEDQANRAAYFPSISGNGRYVAFFSGASNLVRGDTRRGFDVFLRDRNTGTTRQVSVSSDGTKGNRISGWPAISANGRYVVFQSNASNLVPHDANNMYDLFVRGPLH
jgi:archaellum component FlaF (FlaF/FlaG flagellin family)